MVVQSARRAAGSSAALTLFGTTATRRFFPMGSVAGSRLAMSASCACSASTAAAGSLGDVAPPAAGDKKPEKEAASYWGVAPTRLVKEDGTEWKWSCFRVRAIVMLP